ncbi:beta strand repeat-containing protein [Terrabacter koreensis]
MSLRALPSDRSPVRHRLLLLLTVVALFVGQGVAGSAPARAALTAGAPTVASAQPATAQPAAGQPAAAQPATASGQVSAADGSGPVVGVVVKALVHGSADFTPVATATTGSTGSWSMTDLPPGDYDLQFDASDTAYLSQWWSGAASRDTAGILSASAGSTLPGLNASLTRGATVSGRVTDGAGSPLADVLVTPREKAAGAVTSSAVATAADGTFTVRGLSAGTYTLAFSAAGRVSWSYGMKAATDAPTYFAVAEGVAVTGRSMALPAGSTSTRSLLAAAADTTVTVSGHVYAGSTATPLEGALVVAVAADSDVFSSGLLNTTTDAAGAWTIAGLPADVYTVHVLPPSASPYTEQWWNGAQTRSRAAYAVLPGGTSRTAMDATLDLAGAISGRVTTSDGSAGIADVVVQAAPVGTDTWSSTTTDVDGNYTLGGLAPAAYVLQFDGQFLGFQTPWWSSTSPSGVATRDAATPITVGAGATVSGRDITMAQAGSITGTVVDQSNAPVADARVDIWSADPAVTDTAFAVTDIGGNFDSMGLPAGHYIVRVTPPAGSGLATQYYDTAFSPTTATPFEVLDGVTGRADFTLVPGGTLSGKVLRPDGTPVPGTGNLMVAPASDPTFKDFHPIANDGTFTVSELGPGGYVVSAVADGTVVTYYGSAGSTTDVGAATAVSLAAGGTVPNLSIRLAAGATISGRVTEGGAAASAGQLSVIDVSTGAQLGSADLGGGASYTVSGLPAGTYAVLATGSTGATRWFGDTTTWADSTLVTLSGGATRTGIDIALPAAGAGSTPTSTVSGRIVLPPGAATTDYNNLSVSLEDAAGQSYTTFSINADGTFDILDVPDGTLKVHLADLTSELVLQAPLTVTAPTTSLEVRTDVGGSVVGSLVNEAGKPLPNVDVTAFYSPGVTSSTLSGADGTFRIGGLLAGQVRLHLGPASPYAGTWVGGSQAPSSGTVYDVVLGTPTNAGQLTVPLGGTVAGTVTAPANAQGTEVTIEALDASGNIVGATTVVGTHAYELAGLLPGTVRVRFSGHGLAPQLWSATAGGSASNVAVVAGQTRADVDATLAPPPSGTASVAGIVTAQGNPVSRAIVTVVRTGDGQPAGSATTNASGGYLVSGLPAGAYRIEVDACLTNGGGGARVAGPLCVASTPLPVSLTDGENLTAQNVELSSVNFFTAAPQPTINGTVRVGSQLSVADGTWTPTPTTLAHRWLVGGLVVSTSGTYTPGVLDQGKTVTVETTATLAGYAPRTTSQTTPPVGPGLLTPAPTPTISGTAQVGLRLTANPGTWGPLPVTLKYQWLRNGVAVTGATASSYVPTPSDRTARMSVTVTGLKTGYSAVAHTSAQTLAVATGVLTPTPVPKITGTVKVGYRLTATAGTWGPLPVTLKYQWRRNGVAITGATASTYLLGAGDRTARMTVTVTGMKTGYTTVAKTSLATLAVATGSLTATPVPRITGTTRVGSRLTATAGTWSPAPVTLKYQWRRNGVAITGATASTYVIASSMRGARITVTVTGAKTGYTSVARTSTATAVIS